MKTICAQIMSIMVFERPLVSMCLHSCVRACVHSCLIKIDFEVYFFKRNSFPTSECCFCHCYRVVTLFFDNIRI